MPRPKKPRFCRPFDGYKTFKPVGVPLKQLLINNLALDELEAMRLCDLQDLDQVTAAAQMNVSRGTVQRLLYSGRKKMVDALVNSKALSLVGGDHIQPRGRRRRGKGPLGRGGGRPDL